MVVKSLRRLLVVDDDPSIIEGLKFCLGSQYVVTGVNSGEEALEAVQENVYPVVVLDLRMKGISGTETLKALKKRWRHQQVIVFTGHLSGKSAMGAVNHGAFRYLTKPFRLEEFQETVKKAFAQFERELKADAAELEGPEQLEMLGLSEREAEVAFRLLQDDGTVEIAAALDISPRTVEKHIERIFYQLGISVRTRLAARVRELRLEFLLAETLRGGSFCLGGTCFAASMLTLGDFFAAWELTVRAFV